MRRRISISTPISLAAVGFYVAAVLAAGLGYRLRPLNLLVAGGIALAVSFGAATVLHEEEVEEPQPVPGAVSEQLGSGRSREPRGGGETEGESGDDAHLVTFDWRHLVASTWEPGSQCGRCAQPLQGRAQRCERCNAPVDRRAAPVTIATSGPFLQAIEALHNSGGVSDV